MLLPERGLVPGRPRRSDPLGAVPTVTQQFASPDGQVCCPSKKSCNALVMRTSARWCHLPTWMFTDGYSTSVLPNRATKLVALSFLEISNPPPDAAMIGPT